ncbi:MAG: periplasmic heavy metal sensor [Pseudomonadota bacterium]
MSRRWRSVILCGSVALNLFLLGAIVGGGLAGLRLAKSNAGPRVPVTADYKGAIDPQVVVGALDHGQRRKVRREILGAVREMRPVFDEVIEARGAALEVLEAEAFDVEAFRAALTRLEEAEQVARLRGYETFASISEDLNLEDRQRVAGALREDRRLHQVRRRIHRHMRHGGPGPHGPPPRRPGDYPPPPEDGSEL